MKDTKESSDGEQSLSPMIPDPASDSAAARKSLLLHLIQTLDHSDRDGVTSLEKSIKLAITRRRRVLNEKNSPLLKLPAELIVAIGCQVKRVNRMGTHPAPMPGLHPPRSNFRTAIWFFMNTCSRLRGDLNMVPPTAVTLCYQPVEPRHFVERCKKIRRHLEHYGTLQSRPLLIYMYIPRSRCLSGSTAAAFAAFVECSLFGSLQDPPVVYAQTGHDREMRRNQGTDFFIDVCISHARELGMKRMKWYPSTQSKETLIRADEAKSIWKKLEEAPKSKETVFQHQTLVKKRRGQRQDPSTLPTCAPLCNPTDRA